MRKKSSIIRLFIFISRLEGISFLLLLGIAMPLKYVLELDMAVTIAGWIHGILFMLYFMALIPARSAGKWSWGFSVWVMLASLIPLAPFKVEKQLSNMHQLL